MSSIPAWGYLVILVAALAMSLVLVPVALAVALRIEAFDHPGPAKSHEKAVPYLGGAAIVIAFAAVVLIGNAVDPPPSGYYQLVGFLGLGVMLSIVGLVDDLRVGGLSPVLRLAFEIAAAVAVCALGSNAHLAGVPTLANDAITVIWVVGITNAFNLLDNMDGLSAGIATIACLAIFGVAALQQRYLVAALALAMAGCAAGFLRSNFHPAKIYMGDAGSLFLGFVIAVLLLKLRGPAPTRVPIAVIVAIPGVAVFDTTLVTVSRLAHHRSPFQGGKDHTSHRLLRLGFSVHQAVGTIYGAGLVLGGAALGMAEAGDRIRLVGVGGLAIVTALAAWPLGRVRVRPTDDGSLVPDPEGQRQRLILTSSHDTADGPADPAAVHASDHVG
ncbi:MAG TPA: MraY family glycosyltransferase [Acidimicrobiales bacterium]|nr:MraY family glycosyltransferase [Acidimicrobiales bacterium]